VLQFIHASYARFYVIYLQTWKDSASWYDHWF